LQHTHRSAAWEMGSVSSEAPFIATSVRAAVAVGRRSGSNSRAKSAAREPHVLQASALRDRLRAGGGKRSGTGTSAASLRRPKTPKSKRVASSSGSAGASVSAPSLRNAVASDGCARVSGLKRRAKTPDNERPASSSASSAASSFPVSASSLRNAVASDVDRMSLPVPPVPDRRSGGGDASSATASERRSPRVIKTTALRDHLRGKAKH
jgi:hypothetical protein